jgi:hypothetical protein
VDPKQLLSSTTSASPPPTLLSSTNYLSTCPQTRTRVFYNKTRPPIQNNSFSSLQDPANSIPAAARRRADPPTPRPSETGQSTSTAPSCPGSPLPQLHQQSHQQVNRYICVICISHPTQTTSDTSRPSSCNHFAYRGNLVAPTSVATANTSPPRRMSR